MDPVPNEPRWQEPRRQHITCALDPSNPTENNSTLAVAFAVADINDVYECFVLQVRTLLKEAQVVESSMYCTLSFLK